MLTAPRCGDPPPLADAGSEVAFGLFGRCEGEKRREEKGGKRKRGKVGRHTSTDVHTALYAAARVCVWTTATQMREGTAPSLSPPWIRPPRRGLDRPFAISGVRPLSTSTSPPPSPLSLFLRRVEKTVCCPPPPPGPRLPRNSLSCDRKLEEDRKNQKPQWQKSSNIRAQGHTNENEGALRIWPLEVRGGEREHGGRQGLRRQSKPEKNKNGATEDGLVWQLSF
ncbi:hypothetical protein LX36DRAFT_657647 [Colletotrichum falcatum]|nr:hypothetical protein LX36DRAFT_657647 [Colletotrichum falcatum]